MAGATLAAARRLASPTPPWCLAVTLAAAFVGCHPPTPAAARDAGLQGFSQISYPDAGGSPGPNPIGSACTTDGDCASGICLQEQGVPGGLCTQQCAAAPCPGSSICAVMSGNPLCFADCASCNRPGWSCADLEYLGPAVCLPPCATLGTCQQNGPGDEADASIVNPSELDAGLLLPPESDAGTLSLVADDLDYPTSITMESGMLFVALDDENGGIIAVEPSAGEISERVTGSYPSNLTSDDAHLYWTATDSEDDDDGEVMQAALDGTSTLSLASGLPYVPVSLAIDAQHVYWSAPGVTDGQVLSVPIGGGAVTTLAAGQSQPSGLLVVGSSLYWSSGAFSAAYPNNVSGMFDNGAVIAFPLPGGPVTTLAGNQASPLALASDADNIYWVNAGLDAYDPVRGEVYVLPNTGSVVRAPRTGGPPVTLAAGQDNPVNVTLASGVLYWLNAGTQPAGGALQAIRLPGGGSLTLLTSLLNPSALLVAGSTLYVTDNGTDGTNGTVEQLVLPAGGP